MLTTRFEELPPDAAREALVDIQTAATRLRGTIDCLLDYVRLGPRVENGISLRDVLTRVSSLLRPLFRTGAHRLEIETFEGDDVVVGNVLAIEQIFVNLLTNARDASPEGGEVVCRLERHGETLRVTVADRGAGVGAARDRVFQPFYTTKKSGGTGLGLAISRDIVRRHGGEIALEPRDGGGTEARVDLPRIPEGSPS